MNAVNGQDGSSGLAPPRVQGGYGRTAGRGMLWVTLQAGTGKVAALASQIALGWLLATEDFALFALAIGMAGIVAALRDGGMDRVLMQRGDEFAALARPALALGMAFKAVGALLMVALAGPAAVFFESPQLLPLMWVLAASLLLNAPLGVLRARLSVDLRFGVVARIGVMRMLAQHGLMVTLAVLGFGAMSFVLPLLVVAVLEGLLLVAAIGGWPGGGEQRDFRATMRDLLGAAKWLAISAIGNVIASRVPYVLIGALAGKTVLGFYFFGFQLIGSALQLFTESMPRVMMPALSRVHGDSARLRRGYLRAMRLLLFAAAPCLVLAALLAEPVMGLVWAGRWDGAVPAVTVLALAGIGRIMESLGYCAIEAKGHWRRRAVLAWVGAVAMLSAAGLGAAIGTVTAIATAVGAGQVVMAITVNIAVARLLELRWMSLLAAMLPPLAVTGVSGITVWLLLAPITAPLPALWHVAALAAAFALLHTSLSGLLLRPAWRELVNLVRRRSDGDAMTANASMP